MTSKPLITSYETEILEKLQAGADLTRAVPGGCWLDNKQISGKTVAKLHSSRYIKSNSYNTPHYQNFEISDLGKIVLEDPIDCGRLGEFDKDEAFRLCRFLWKMDFRAIMMRNTSSWIVFAELAAFDKYAQNCAQYNFADQQGIKRVFEATWNLYPFV